MFLINCSLFINYLHYYLAWRPRSNMLSIQLSIFWLHSMHIVNTNAIDIYKKKITVYISLQIVN